MEKGLVSVVIPTFKRNDMLPRAIDSVLGQTYQSVEILIVDDNEPGDAFFNENVILLKKYENIPNVKHIVQEHHTNGAIARNLGVKLAKGEFVAFLDDDDEWLPNKLEKQVEFLNSNQECGAVSCLTEIYKDGKLIGKSCPYESKNLQFNVLLRIVGIGTPSFCGRTEILLKSRLFDPKLKRHQDLQFFVDFLNISNIEPINEVLYHIHADSIINRPNTVQLIEYKKQYFNSISDTLDKLDDSLRRRVYNAHYFEVVFSALKEHKFYLALSYLFKIGFHLKSYSDLYVRYSRR